MSLGILWKRIYGFRCIGFLRVVASSKAKAPLSLTCCMHFMVDFYIIASAITMHALFMWLAIMKKGKQFTCQNTLECMTLNQSCMGW